MRSGEASRENGNDPECDEWGGMAALERLSEISEQDERKRIRQRLAQIQELPSVGDQLASPLDKKRAPADDVPARESNRRRWYTIGAVGGIVVVAILSLFLFGIFGPPAQKSTPTLSPSSTTTAKPGPTLAPSATATPSPAPSATPTVTPAPSATSTQPPAPTNTPAATSTPKAAAIVLADGAGLRPGATTWWHVHRTLAPETELELIGYDPDFPDWVYVRTTDDGVEGWVQVEEIEMHRELDKLPRVTPRPTLTPTPGTDLPSECAGGPLWLDAWPVGTECTASGWEAIIFVQGHGGDCLYTYAWEGEMKAGPLTGSTTFRVGAAPKANIIGNVSVTSAGQTVSTGLFIPPPADCGN